MYVNSTKIHEEDFSTIKTKELYLLMGPTGMISGQAKKLPEDKQISKETPLDIMPLYVKAGSILPFGPEVQYATEKKWDDLEIRIYPGANGEFILYEDENDNYNYEKGAYSTITFTWNDAKRRLTINDRRGSFPGMLETGNSISLLLILIKALEETWLPHRIKQ